MKILIATVKTPFCRGGAEILADQLQTALEEDGHQAHIVAIPYRPWPPDAIIDQILACRLIDVTEAAGRKIDRLIGLKFPAYLMSHPNRIMWLVHQHRTAYDLWDHPMGGDLLQFPGGERIRDAIHHADETLIPQSKAVYTISQNVSNRLRRFSGIDSTPLYQPPHDEARYFCREAEDYFFFPSRLTRIKRQELVLESLARTKQPVRVRFAGGADYPPYAGELQAMARRLGVDSRVEWMGSLSEQEVLEPYARCVGVVYPPVDEDYGFVTLEAMLSSKPVITCTDSGGPLEFIRQGESGLVTDPDPVALANALDILWQDRARAASMGRQGRSGYLERRISWRNVVRTLLS